MGGMKHDPVDVAVIGAGLIADYHVHGLRHVRGTRVAALVGRRPEAVRRKASDLGIPRAETDYRAVLADPRIDAVVVATPDDTHALIAKEALAAGKPVLLQKPMALDGQECRSILEAEASSGATLTVSFMHRYFPEVSWLRRLLAEAALGDIHTIRIRNATPGADWNDWFYAADRVSGGVVMQLGVHGIDLCQHLFGRIADVSARARTSKPQRRLRDGRVVTSRLEDNVLATYALEGGAMATHEMSYTELAGCDRFRVEVYGERGTAWLRSERGAAALFAPDLTGRDEWVVPRLPDAPAGAVHHRHWIAIVRGEAPRDDTPEAGLASIEVAEAIYRAAASGGRLPVGASGPEKDEA